MVKITDSSIRAYPNHELKAVTQEEGHQDTETARDNEKFITRRNVKTLTFEVWNVSEQYFAKTQEQCTQFGLFFVDLCDNLKGQKEGDFLYPRPVNENSFFAKYIDSTDTTGAKVMYTMDYGILTNDGDQWMLQASNFDDASISAGDLLGMIDVRFSIVSVDSNVTVTVDSVFDYGDAAAPKPWVGALAADFTLTNKTTPAVVVPTLATPDPVIDGRYQLTFTLQPAGDLVDVDAFRAATGNLLNGFEGIAAEFTAIV